MTEATKGRGCKFSPNMDTLSGAFNVDAADHRCDKMKISRNKVGQHSHFVRFVRFLFINVM